MSHRALISQVAIHVFSLLVGYSCGFLLASGDRSSFAAMTAWWLALYVGRITDVPLVAAVPVIVLYTVVLATDILFDRRWFYPEGASSNVLGYMLLSAIGLVMVISPMVINAGVRRLRP